MPEPPVSVDGLDEVVRKLERAGGAALAHQITMALVAVGEEVRDQLSVQPRPPTYPLRWASQKQAFYVKNVLRKGLGPYVRRYDPMSQDLLHSWTVQPQRPIGAVVGTRVTYAPYVQSAKQQQPFHADTGWVTDDQAVETVRASGSVERIIQDALSKLLR